MRYAAVLAGGQSSRMGQDKSRLVLHGQTLLERALALLTSAGAERVLLSGGGHESPSPPELADPPAYRRVPDLYPHSGPPGGVYSLLAWLHAHDRLDGSPLLLIPVDMPLLKAPTLRYLLDISANTPCCHYEGEVFPCVLPATPALYEHLGALFADGAEAGGKRSMKAIMQFAGAQAIPISAGTAEEFRNVNTQADWQAIIASAATLAD